MMCITFAALAEEPGPAAPASPPAAAAGADVLKVDAVRKAMDAYHAAIVAAKEKYQNVLQIVLDECMKKGDLEASKQIKGEMQRIAGEKVTSSDADFASVRARAGHATFARSLDAATKVCRSALDNAVKAEVKAGRLEQAEAIKALMDNLALAGQAGKKPAVQPAAQIRIVPESQLPPALKPGDKAVRPTGVSASSSNSPADKPEFSIDGDPSTTWQLGRYAFPGWITFTFDKPVRARHVILVQRRPAQVGATEGTRPPAGGDAVAVGRVILNDGPTLEFRNFEPGQVMIIEFAAEAELSGLRMILQEGTYRPGIRDVYALK